MKKGWYQKSAKVLKNGASRLEPRIKKVIETPTANLWPKFQYPSHIPRQERREARSFTQNLAPRRLVSVKHLDYNVKNLVPEGHLRKSLAICL